MCQPFSVSLQLHKATGEGIRKNISKKKSECVGGGEEILCLRNEMKRYEDKYTDLRIELEMARN